MDENVAKILLQVGKWIVISIGIIIVLGIWSGILYYFFNKKQYKHYRVFIYRRHKDKDDNEIPIFVGWDKAAIRKDKKLKRFVFHIKRLNLDMGEEELESYDEDRTLDVPTIPSDKGGEIAFVEKLGPRKYAFGRALFEGHLKVIVSSADLAEAMRAYDVNARTFHSDKWKWAGPIIFAVFALLIIVLFWVLLQKFDVIRESMEIALEIAKTNAQAKAGAAVSSGAPI